MARIEAQLTTDEVVKELCKVDIRFDKSLLSRIENGLCLPTLNQIAVLTTLYNQPINDLIGIYTQND